MISLLPLSDTNEIRTSEYAAFWAIPQFATDQRQQGEDDKSSRSDVHESQHQISSYCVLVKQESIIILH